MTNLTIAKTEETNLSQPIWSIPGKNVSDVVT